MNAHTCWAVADNPWMCLQLLKPLWQLSVSIQSLTENQGRKTPSFPLYCHVLDRHYLPPNYVWHLHDWNANLKNTIGVVNISIFLILKLEDRKTVWYCTYPTVLSPEEQQCDPNQWTINPLLQCMWLLHATVCRSPLFPPNLSSYVCNCIWWQGERGTAKQESVENEEEQPEGEQTLRWCGQIK